MYLHSCTLIYNHLRRLSTRTDTYGRYAVIRDKCFHPNTCRCFHFIDKNILFCHRKLISYCQSPRRQSVKCDCNYFCSESIVVTSTSSYLHNVF